MNRIITPLAIAGLMLAGPYAFAGDEVSQAGMAQQNKMMKDCLAKHAAADHRMTQDEDLKGVFAVAFGVSSLRSVPSERTND